MFLDVARERSVIWKGILMNPSKHRPVACRNPMIENVRALKLPWLARIPDVAYRELGRRWTDKASLTRSG